MGVGTCRLLFVTQHAVLNYPAQPWEDSCPCLLPTLLLCSSPKQAAMLWGVWDQLFGALAGSPLSVTSHCHPQRQDCLCQSCWLWILGLCKPFLEARTIFKPRQEETGERGREAPCKPPRGRARLLHLLYRGESHACALRLFFTKLLK